MHKIHKVHYTLLIALALGLGLFLFWYQSDDKKSLVSIRSYEEAKDHGPLISVMNDNLYWLSERKDFSPHRVLAWKAPFDDEKRMGEAKILVADFEGNTAGFVTFFKNSPKEGFIWLLAVDQKFRGHGIGEELMKNAIKDLKSKKSEYIILATRTINHSALKLYKKLGFKEIETNDRGIVTLKLNLF